MDRLQTWWKPGLALLLAFFAMQVGAWLLVRTDRAHAWLSRQLENSFGRAVDVRQYSASLFPTPQLDAYGISVDEDPAFGHEYFLRAERLSAGLRWTGLLRGRFELGALRLEKPSLIFVRNHEGRWNLELWLPAATQAVGSPANSGAPSGYAHHLEKIEISDGRANFKLGDDKTPFAFITIEGSVEQTAPGRWKLDLHAEPWRSGVPLQLAGTVRVHGDVAGTSARLQPAHFQVSWEKSSLADVFRLVGGRDFGIRGLFAAEATAESGGSASSSGVETVPGDWLFTLQARASEIHRWDLTERTDNPRVGFQVSGRWNPGAGTMSADRLTLESPRSNLRGTASLKSIAESSLEIRMDSGGIQAADLLDWYRAFKADVSDDIRVQQYFSGNATLRGWPLTLTQTAFSSPGGRWTVPGFATPVEARAVRGGLQDHKLIVEPFGVTIPPARIPGKSSSSSSSPSGAGGAGAIANVSLIHDFEANTGGIRIEGQAARVQDVFRFATAFGRPLQNGWELRGKASADLRWEWSAEKLPAWNGRADVTQATLQVAGLNQPVQLEAIRAEWRMPVRKFTLTKVNAFGANWSGSVEQSKILQSDFGETEISPWSFQLQADHLDAAELDRWIGPRARPNWLQRLLPRGLGGSSSAEPPSAVLRRIRAAGDLRVDEVTIEKIRMRQFRAQAKIDALNLTLQNVQAQWSGGEVKGIVEAAFSPKPRYEIAAAFEHVAISQMPWLARLSDHLAGTAAGSLQLKAGGIGREALLASLAGKGEIRLANVELRGWDLAGTMALGEWTPGNSRWTAGAGTFHFSDGGFDLNTLRLTAPTGEFLLKGSVSFSEVTDLTAESHATGRNARAENTVRFMQISGTLAEPKVSLEKTAVQQPGD